MTKRYVIHADFDSGLHTRSVAEQMHRVSGFIDFTNRDGSPAVLLPPGTFMRPADAEGEVIFRFVPVWAVQFIWAQRADVEEIEL
jgi:hypothetical protein